MWRGVISQSICELWKWYYNMHYDRLSGWFSLFFHPIAATAADATFLNKVPFFLTLVLIMRNVLNFPLLFLFDLHSHETGIPDKLQINVSCNSNHPFGCTFFYSSHTHWFRMFIVQTGDQTLRETFYSLIPNGMRILLIHYLNREFIESFEWIVCKIPQSDF